MFSSSIRLVEHSTDDVMSAVFADCSHLQLSGVHVMTGLWMLTTAWMCLQTLLRSPKSIQVHENVYTNAAWLAIQWAQQALMWHCVALLHQVYIIFRPAFNSICRVWLQNCHHVSVKRKALLVAVSNSQQVSGPFSFMDLQKPIMHFQTHEAQQCMYGAVQATNFTATHKNMLEDPV